MIRASERSLSRPKQFVNGGGRMDKAVRDHLRRLTTCSAFCMYGCLNRVANGPAGSVAAVTRRHQFVNFVKVARMMT
jgi:hypothetical protein